MSRFNAISLGFRHNSTNKSKIWVDLIPNFSKNSTRKFLIKVTTLAQPWGYKNNDSCDILSTSDKREAMRLFGKTDGKTLFQTKLTIDEGWPVEANCPIPLHIIIANSYQNSEDEFCSACINGLKCENSQYQKYISKFDIKERIRPFWKIIKDVCDNYYIPFSILNHDIIEKESETTDRAQITDLEVLFGRITSGGTQITQAELSYSAIKVYWPKIRTMCDELSIRCIPSHSLANLLFRLYKICKGGNWINSNLRISEIRNLSSSDNKEVDEFFERMENVIIDVNNWLTNEEYGLPPILKTAIARQKTDIYILLLWFASKRLHGSTLLLYF